MESKANTSELDSACVDLLRLTLNPMDLDIENAGNIDAIADDIADEHDIDHAENILSYICNEYMNDGYTNGDLWFQAIGNDELYATSGTYTSIIYLIFELAKIASKLGISVQIVFLSNDEKLIIYELLDIIGSNISILMDKNIDDATVMSLLFELDVIDYNGSFAVDVPIKYGTNTISSYSTWLNTVGTTMTNNNLYEYMCTELLDNKLDMGF